MDDNKHKIYILDIKNLEPGSFSFTYCELFS